MKYLFLILFLVSIAVNVAGVWAVKYLYKKENAVRLDPLQLSVYPENLPKNSALKRVVLFGDSRALSWPAPEAEGVEFLNRGIGDQTSAQIRLRYVAHVQPLKADLIVLQLGVNDLKTLPLFPERQTAIVEQLKVNLQWIVQQARADGSRVLITTIFPVGKVPLERRLVWSDAVAPAIREMNTFIASLAGEGVQIFDTFSVLQGEIDLIKPDYSRDLLHLNVQGYAALNTALLPFLQH
ncbi:SGNH/GDSL hydrolase family protein [uncultured Thiothrix sp.]|uniref:SGNH/GDSL hydrolase family protein n=1 Tax=uncultured Thiothrix sp. TaxID=223185 RepID=UPI00260D8787|nr:SGNH/GDSL hydrolase family protein [uncultured Thiothrix sp.]